MNAAHEIRNKKITTDEGVALVKNMMENSSQNILRKY